MGIGRATRLGASVVVVGLVVLGMAGSAYGTSPQWLPGQTIDPTQNPINSLSCPSALTCLGVTDVAVVVQDDALSYERNPDSSIMDAVSCAPGTRFCMFVDNSGGAFTYINGTFSSVTTVDPSDVEIDGVSCPSAGFCMAINHNNVVFKYSGGSWDSGFQLPIPMGDTPSNFVNISCASGQFCMALVGTDMGVLYYTWDGTGWTGPLGPFDTTAGHVVSLTCTSTTFCLETDDVGQAAVFNGSWSNPQSVDASSGQPILYSSCVGTSCVAADFNDNSYTSPDGTTWTSGVNLHTSTGISGVDSLTCATATLCVAGGGEGDATTYAVSPSPGKPALTGTPTAGQPLALTHASVQTTPVWFADDWRRCGGPDSSCSFNPISRSATGYTLTTADVGKYIDARETIGFGFDEEGPIVSNIVGPITPKPGTARFTGSVTTTKTGVVTISLHCTGGPCRGTVKLTYKGTGIGSAGYSIAAGVTAKVKDMLNTFGKNQLKKHNWQLPVKLIITPARGTPTSVSITLRA
jgi:hypothetical protein